MAKRESGKKHAEKNEKSESGRHKSDDKIKSSKKK